MKESSPEPTTPTWRSLYRVGGAAPLVTLSLYLGQLVIIALSRVPYPDHPESWLALFQRSKLLGLIFLNALDIISITILGLMFLALFIALKGTHPSYMLIAALFAFLGIASFISTRALMVSAALTLSDQYAAATTEMQRTQIQTAWGAITSPARATPETMGFLLMAVAGLIISIVILRSNYPSRTIGFLGILGGVVTFVDQISLVVAPLVAVYLMPVNGLLWLVWWILVSRLLFKLSESRIF